VTGYNDFDLDQVLVFLMPGFSCFFNNSCVICCSIDVNIKFWWLAEWGREIL